MAKEISINGIIFLRQLEGCKLTAYPDTGGKFTIGVGTTHYKDGSPVREGDKITQEQADTLLKDYLIGTEKDLNGLIKVPVTQNQFDALCCHLYNNDIALFKRSTLLKLLNLKEYEMAANEILKWNKVRDKKTGLLKVDKGLVNRTKAERELFLKPD